MSAAENRSSLESAHQHIGTLLKAGNRLLTCVLTMGGLFCLVAYLLLGLVQQPERVLHMQAFMFNYSEMAATEAVPKPEPIERQVRDTLKSQQDPEWDGMVAGASLGLSIGRNVPVIGMFCGPVLGAIIGYQLDSRL